MEAYVEGIGIVGGFGAGMEAFSTALASGKGPIQAVTYKTDTGTGEMAAFLADTAPLDKFVAKKALRRIDHYSKMALLGSYLALEDARMLDIDPKGLGIVVASGYGASATTFAFLDSFIVTTDTYSSPTYFSNSVHNAAAAHISIFLGATGPCLTVSQFEISVPSALMTAALWLEEGRMERVLFGAVDEYCDVLGYSWRQYFGLNKGGLIEPFLFNQQSAIPGEGAAFFLLSRGEGSGKGYGHVAALEAGYSDQATLARPEGARLILGADGHREPGKRYEQYIDGAIGVASYTPLYGSFPTNTAFDMAAGLLSMKEEKLFGPPAGITCPTALKIDMGAEKLDGTPIRCVKFGNRGETGVVEIK
jgi:3-oxoacyl-[acyl-carrier-protein] synthase II